MLGLVRVWHEGWTEPEGARFLSGPSRALNAAAARAGPEHPRPLPSPRSCSGRGGGRPGCGAAHLRRFPRAGPAPLKADSGF